MFSRRMRTTKKNIPTFRSNTEMEASAEHSEKEGKHVREAAQK